MKFNYCLKIRNPQIAKYLNRIRLKPLIVTFGYTKKIILV